MIPDLPWNVHPELTRERLIEIGQLIAKGRHDAVTWHNEGIGDDGWVLGCRAFQASRHQIIAAAESGAYPWLEIIDSSRHLVFKIGNVPIRFYRGLAEEPTPRTLRQTFPELKQLSLIFDDERKEMAFRLAVETDLDGSVSIIKFVGLLGDIPALCWTVPLDKSVVSVFPVVASVEGVELPAPVVHIPGKTEEEFEAG